MVTDLKLFQSPFKLYSRFHLHKSTNKEQTTQKCNESKEPINTLMTVGLTRSATMETGCEKRDIALIASLGT